MVAAIDYQPGERVAVVQQIPFRDRQWSIRIAGTVLRYEQSRTAASFANVKDDRLWLDRLTLRCDDGAVTTLVLDQYTHVDRLASPPQPAAPAAG